jgi:hypothetical protein
MLKKFLFLFTIFVLLGNFAMAIIPTEKIFNQTYNDISAQKYTEFCRKLRSLIRENNIYIVFDRRGKKHTHIYACDGRGERKVYADIYHHAPSMNMELKVTIEGDIEETKANTMAEELGKMIIEKSKVF